MRGLKADLVLIDEYRDFMEDPVGCIRCACNLFRVQHTCGKQFDKKANISEQVTPAAPKGQHVEQQTEEQNVQLSQEVEGES